MYDRILSTILTIATVVLVAAFVHSKYFKSSGADPGRYELEYRKDWKQLQSSGVSTDTTKPIQIIEFVDLECPACRGANAAIEKVVRAYPVGRTLIHFPLEIHRSAIHAAKMAECAGLESFWQMHDVLLSKQESLGVKPWVQFAVEAGVSDLKKWESCVDSPTGSFERIQGGRRVGESLGVVATPTILVNGWKLGDRVQKDSATLTRIVTYILGGKNPKLTRTN